MESAETILLEADLVVIRLACCSSDVPAAGFERHFQFPTPWLPSAAAERENERTAFGLLFFLFVTFRKGAMTAPFFTLDTTRASFLPIMVLDLFDGAIGAGAFLVELDLSRKGRPTTTGAAAGLISAVESSTGGLFFWLLFVLGLFQAR